MAGFLNWLKGSKQPEDKQAYKDDLFAPGQCWSYQARPGEEDSRLTVLKVEHYEHTGVVVHVQVKGVRVNNPMVPSGFTEEIGHLPFAKEAVAKSVTAMLSEGNALPDFMDGYTNWKEAFEAKKGGIFSNSVGEAVNFLEEAMANARRVE